MKLSLILFVVMWSEESEDLWHFLQIKSTFKAFKSSLKTHLVEKYLA